jgi:hypothetical protein
MSTTANTPVRVLPARRPVAAVAAPRKALVEQPEIKVDAVDGAEPSVDAHEAGFGAKASLG